MIENELVMIREFEVQLKDLSHVITNSLIFGFVVLVENRGYCFNVQLYDCENGSVDKSKIM